MTTTQEDHFCRDISAIKKALQSIAKDLRYFRKKDEAAAAEKKEEEPEYTCKDCVAYKTMAGGGTNVIIHWCELHGCTVSDEGLKEPCADFEKDGEF